MRNERYVPDPRLREYATDRQWELLEAWEEHGTQNAAARALGVDPALIRHARKRVEEKAARQGLMIGNPTFGEPDPPGVPVPPGYVLRGQSALVDGKGKVRQRWDKTKQGGMDEEQVVRLPDPRTITKVSTMVGADGRPVVQWVAEKPEEITKAHAWELFFEEMKREIPRAEPLPPPDESRDSQLLAGYPVGDHHLGMLSWAKETGGDYDLEIGQRLIRGAFTYLMGGAMSCAGTALVAFLGDYLHYDGFEAVTPTSRNQLDSDTRFPKMIRAGVDTMRFAVDLALHYHQRVRVVVEPGNHDLLSSVWLAECLRIAYENEPRVDVDTSPRHFHYYRHGRVLIGVHHGHGIDMRHLPLTMAADVPEDWAASDHRHIWTGHIHKSKVQPATSAQDFSGVLVESFRILPPADAWAANKGYRPIRGQQAILYHETYGEVSRVNVTPQMLELFREEN